MISSLEIILRSLAGRLVARKYHKRCESGLVPGRGETRAGCRGAGGAGGSPQFGARPHGRSVSPRGTRSHPSGQGGRGKSAQSQEVGAARRRHAAAGPSGMQLSQRVPDRDGRFPTEVAEHSFRLQELKTALHRSAEQTPPRGAGRCRALGAGSGSAGRTSGPKPCGHSARPWRSRAVCGKSFHCG